MFNNWLSAVSTPSASPATIRKNLPGSAQQSPSVARKEVKDPKKKGIFEVCFRLDASFAWSLRIHNLNNLIYLCCFLWSFQIQSLNLNDWAFFKSGILQVIFRTGHLIGLNLIPSWSEVSWISMWTDITGKLQQSISIYAQNPEAKP